MSLLLKILPIFPFIDHELVIEVVTKAEDSWLFNCLVIEYFYRAIVEVTSFHVICYFRHRTDRSLKDVLQRIGITFGLILWNYIGLSVNVFKTEPYKTLGQPYFKLLYYDLVLFNINFFGNIYFIIFFSRFIMKLGNNTNQTKLKSYILVIEGIFYKYCIDGDLFFNYLFTHKSFLYDEEFRSFGFSGILLKAYFLLKWNISTMETSSLFIYFPLVIGAICLCAYGFYEIMKNPIIVRQLSELKNDHRIKKSYDNVWILLAVPCFIELQVIFHVFYSKGYNSFTMVMTKLIHLCTFASVLICSCCYEASRGRTDLSVTYLLYGNGDGDGDGELDEKEKINMNDKDTASP